MKQIFQMSEISEALKSKFGEQTFLLISSDRKNGQCFVIESSMTSLTSSTDAPSVFDEALRAPF